MYIMLEYVDYSEPFKHVEHDGFWTQFERPDYSEDVEHFEHVEHLEHVE